MPVITEIKADDKNKSRIRVFTDSGFCVCVTAESVVKCRLNVGDEVCEETLQRAVTESDTQTAFVKSVNLVCRAPKTRRQVEEYLLKKGYTEEVIFAVLEKMEEYRYLDDAQYAKQYVDFYGSGKGRYKLTSELKQRGVDEAHIEAAEAELPEQTATAMRLAEKFLRTRDRSRATMEKLYRHLAGKGFESSVCVTAVKNCCAEFATDGEVDESV